MTRIALAAVLLTGCVAMGPAVGSVRYSGSDPMGSYDGSVSPAWCTATFQGTDINALFMDGRRYVGSDAPGHIVTVGARGSSWGFTAQDCTVFEQHHWFDPPQQLHVTVQIDCVDATSGAHLVGSVSSDNCYVRRP